MAPGSEQHGEDVEAGGEKAAYKAALESWLDQALELRDEYTTLQGLKSAMEDEEPSTSFPVLVREEGDGPRTFLAAWLSMEPGDGEPSYYFQSLYLTPMDRCDEIVRRRRSPLSRTGEGAPRGRSVGD